MKHDIKGDMKAEGETLKAEKKEPPAGDPQDKPFKAKKVAPRSNQFALPRSKK
jgi:hypothetical protein